MFVGCYYIMYFQKNVARHAGVDNIATCGPKIHG